MKKVTVNTIIKYKNENKKITALTAYDYSTAKYIDQARVDIILVGDSLAMVALGYETTHAVTVDEMLHHSKAVVRGSQNALVVADMPFMSYQTDKKTAVENAGRFIKEAGVSAIKIEGGSDFIVDIISHCTSVGIPVLGHLGFTPQYLYTLGGYNIQGKTLEATQELLEQARAVEQAGAFAVVLEMVPEEVSKYITEKINIPTIGIGAGRYCSGQILVTDDILAKYSDFTPKFARKYTNLSDIMIETFENYKNDVESMSFPAENEIFQLSEDEKNRLKNNGLITSK